MTNPSRSANETTGTVHATALVVGETGLLVTGPSGSGKSRLALAMIQAARARGAYATLVSDDRVRLQVLGSKVIAIAPLRIAGMIELRGSGILKVDHLPRAIMHMAISVDLPQEHSRLPAADARYSPQPGIDLPLVHLVPGHLHDPTELIDALLQDRLLH
ncbi:MAG: HPr kinase/phosphatase C-terminal domain-containing protein [Alphaproteobacteria bacterium]|nr:HPr kinase/phosphatase C-terminal domain-containing protein [Alphaproteobacteria bacterium]